MIDTMKFPNEIILLQEASPLLSTMVAEKVSISQQVLVSQSELSQSRHFPQYFGALIGNYCILIH